MFSPGLRHLEWVGKSDCEDKTIAKMLRSCVSGWKVLKLPHMENFGPLSFDALMKSAETLEELTVDPLGYSGREMLLGIIECCKEPEAIGRTCRWGDRL